MSTTFAATAGGALITGYIGSQASNSAANTQANAASAASATSTATANAQMAQQQKMYDANQARLAPFVNTGTQANNTLGDLMGTSGNTGATGYGTLAHQFNTSDLNSTLAPSYQFMLDQGNQNMAASAAARGGLLTGQNAKDITAYNQNYASNGYQQAYNNYTNNQNLLYNKLNGLATTGENAAAQTGSMGTQVSNNIANTGMAGTANANNYATSGAAATAAGIMGASNAWTGAISNGINSGLTMNYLNGMNKAPSTQAPSYSPMQQVNLGNSSQYMPTTTY